MEYRSRHTERLVLREFVHTDFSAVHEYTSDPETVKYMLLGPNNEQDTLNFLDRVIKYKTEDGNSALLLVCARLRHICSANPSGWRAAKGYINNSGIFQLCIMFIILARIHGNNKADRR